MALKADVDVDPRPYRRGDTVKLAYDSKSHDGTRVARDALVWEARSDELHLVVESFNPTPETNSDTWELIVQPDGKVINYENRNRKDGKYSRVVRGENAELRFVPPIEKS